VQRNDRSCNEACPDDRSVARFPYPNINKVGFQRRRAEDPNGDERPGRTP